MTPVYYERSALYVGRLPPLPCRSLTAIRDGNMIWIKYLNAPALVMLDYSQISRKDGTGFATAAECKAYLDAEFEKFPECQPELVLVGNVTIGQASTLTVSIAAGLREVTAPLAGTVPGERYLAFVRSHRIGTGPQQPGRPNQYALHDPTCRTAGQIIVALQAPLLSLGASYSFNVDIVRLSIG